MAKKQFSNKKIIITLIVALLPIVFTSAWYIQRRDNKTEEVNPVKAPASEPETEKLSTPEFIYSADKSYSLTLPANWLYTTNPDNNNSTYTVVAPNKDVLVQKSISFYSLPNQCQNSTPKQGPQSQSFDVEKIELNNVGGYRTEEIDGPASSTPDQKYVSYRYCKNNTSYYAQYTKTVGSEDLTDQFDTLIKTWKF